MRRWLGVALLCGALQGQDPAAGRPRFTGVYGNPEYGYSFRVPAGMVCLGAVPPAPAHGCGMSVGASRQGYLFADGSAAAAADSLEEQLELVREGPGPAGTSGRQVVAEKKIRVLGMDGARLTVTYRQGSANFVQETVYLWRPTKTPVAMLYTVGCTAPASDRAACVQGVDQVMSTFRIQDPE